MGDGNNNQAYCIECGEVITSTAKHCPECGASQTIDTSEEEAVDTNTGQDTGFTSWAIGFKPGSTVRNILVAFAYLIGYIVGVPLLIYAYWRRGGKYKKRTYAVVVILVVGVFALGALGAAVGPSDEGTASTSGADDSGAGETQTEAGPEFGVRIIYDGSWQGAVSVTGGGSSQTESISGTGTQTIEITGDVDIISVNSQKQDDSSSELKVQILHQGEVVAEASTTAEYGVAQTSESF